MDFDLSRLATIQTWSTAVDHAVAGLADGGGIGPLLADLIDGHASPEIVRVLVDNPALPGLAGELAAGRAGQSLSQLLTANGPDRRSFEVLADSRAVADIGRSLAGHESTEDSSSDEGMLAWRSLAWSLVRSRTVRSQAKAIPSSLTAQSEGGPSEAGGLLGGRRGRRLARGLGHDDSGRSLVRYLVNSPTAEQLALGLTRGRGDQVLARSLAEQVAAVELAQSIVQTANGHRLAWDLTNSRAGRAMTLALTDTAPGRRLLEQLATDEAGRRLTEALVEADADDGLFADTPRDEVAIVRLVTVVALVLMQVIEPQAVGTLTLVAAAAVASPSIAGGATGAPATMAVGQRHRITVDVGPGSTMGEVSQILADLETLTTLAVRLALTERQLAAPSREAADGTVLTWHPVVTDSATAGHVVEQIRYQNPLDVIVASGPALTALSGLTRGLTMLVELVRRRRLDRQQGEAELRKTTAEAERAAAEAGRAAAEARKANAEAANIELELSRQLSEIGNESDLGLTAELTGSVVGEQAGGREALERLSRYPVTVEPLTVPDGQRAG